MDRATGVCARYGVDARLCDRLDLMAIRVTMAGVGLFLHRPAPGCGASIERHTYAPQIQQWTAPVMQWVGDRPGPWQWPRDPPTTSVRPTHTAPAPGFNPSGPAQEADGGRPGLCRDMDWHIFPDDS